MKVGVHQNFIKAVETDTCTANTLKKISFSNKDNFRTKKN